MNVFIYFAFSGLAYATIVPSADIAINNSEAGSNNNAITDAIPRNAQIGTSNNVPSDTVNADNSVPVHTVSIATADGAVPITDNAAVGSNRSHGPDELLKEKTESRLGIIGSRDASIHVPAAVEDNSQNANNEVVHAGSAKLLNHSRIHSESSGQSAKMKSLSDNTANTETSVIVTGDGNTDQSVAIGSGTNVAGVVQTPSGNKTNMFVDYSGKLAQPISNGNSDGVNNEQKKTHAIAKEVTVNIQPQPLTENKRKYGQDPTLLRDSPDTNLESIKGVEPDGTTVTKIDKIALENIIRHTDLVVMPKSEVTNSKISDAIDGDINKPGCNVKNSTCVPTRAELIASGATNVDFMQHRVNSGRLFLDHLKSKGSSSTDATDTASTKIDSIVDNVGQIKIDKKDKMLKEVTTDSDVLPIVDRSSTSALPEVPSHGNDGEINKPGISSGCNVKNSTCVPTRAELIASGATNVDFMQHRVNSGPLFPIQIKPKGSPVTEVKDITSNSIINSIDTAADTQQSHTSCNVENATCIPTGEGINLEGNVDSHSNNPGMSASSQDAPGLENSKSSALNIKTTITAATGAMQPTTTKQIPVPISPTQQTKSTEQTILRNNPQTSTSLESHSVSRIQGTFFANKMIPKKTSTLGSKAGSDTKHIVEVQSCLNINCSGKCKYGKKVDSKGCETCECKFSENCPMVHPASRLLCLLQVRTHLSCGTDADCQRTRICCPGTCGPKCRRPSRSRSMLLSMLID